jgi:hypothetical protein
MRKNAPDAVNAYRYARAEALLYVIMYVILPDRMIASSVCYVRQSAPKKLLK